MYYIFPRVFNLPLGQFSFNHFSKLIILHSSAFVTIAEPPPPPFNCSRSIHFGCGCYKSKKIEIKYFIQWIFVLYQKYKFLIKMF